jgi:hypothetical protein
MSIFSIIFQSLIKSFKDAWSETVTKLKQEEIDDCMPPWGHSDMEALLILIKKDAI